MDIHDYLWFGYEYLQFATTMDIYAYDGYPWLNCGKPYLDMNI